MSPAGSFYTADVTSGLLMDEVAPQPIDTPLPVNIIACSRLGRHANPPGLGLSIREWFRSARRR